jgi:hypothetical protein
MAHLRTLHTPQPQHLQRIKDLEDEVRRLTVENTQMRGELEKAQRRWEKLKEGARRRRGTPVNGVVENPTILEEKEEEREEK